MLSKYWSKLIIVSTITTLISCGDIPTCLDTETSLVKVDFVDSNGVAKDITLLSLHAIGNDDGFPEYADTTLNKLVLPLNPASTLTTFILARTNITDTLELKYSVVAKLISPECGLDASFDKLNIGNTTFIMLEVLENQIHEDIITNIEITL